MSLDDKLREILEDEDKLEIHLMGNRIDCIHPDKAIAAIKQAFADEGYLHISASQETQAAIANTMLGNKVMTGQEWFERFCQEYRHLTLLRVREQFNDREYGTRLYRAAKRASKL
jgi:hypothetical protein